MLLGSSEKNKAKYSSVPTQSTLLQNYGASRQQQDTKENDVTLPNSLNRQEWKARSSQRKISHKHHVQHPTRVSLNRLIHDQTADLPQPNKDDGDAERVIDDVEFDNNSPAYDNPMNGTLARVGMRIVFGNIGSHKRTGRDSDGDTYSSGDSAPENGHVPQNTRRMYFGSSATDIQAVASFRGFFFYIKNCKWHIVLISVTKHIHIRVNVYFLKIKDELLTADSSKQGTLKDIEGDATKSNTNRTNDEIHLNDNRIETANEETGVSRSDTLSRISLKGHFGSGFMNRMRDSIMTNGTGQPLAHYNAVPTGSAIPSFLPNRLVSMEMPQRNLTNTTNVYLEGELAKIYTQPQQIQNNVPLSDQSLSHFTYTHAHTLSQI
ncbi:hypothetical protein RFI_28007 [Reticulomyxa filosa]|uniref:Uncharacterized protein n=1 Tax=Reticulomyxa filosa TaxID=46433 RepID=X6M8P8_RETFI|nr:hypothetical protein RFI_28007 [Reticulomyxa filosa]|eukprot:ETO09370.1 hypothetical protein RFI_28007 [Reticulomyxa filosa]